MSFLLALRKAKVRAELHVFEKGPHGFGLGKPGEAVAAWPTLCENWMRVMGFLEAEKGSRTRDKEQQ